jgi:hypothetical protein
MKTLVGSRMIDIDMLAYVRLFVDIGAGMDLRCMTIVMISKIADAAIDGGSCRLRRLRLSYLGLSCHRLPDLGSGYRGRRPRRSYGSRRRRDRPGRRSRMTVPAMIETLRHTRHGAGRKDQHQDEKFVFYIGLHN